MAVDLELGDKHVARVAQDEDVMHCRETEYVGSRSRYMYFVGVKQKQPGPRIWKVAVDAVQ